MTNGSNQNQERDMELLLPFYVNGTLNDAERAEVEAWIDANPKARTEVAFLERLRQGVKALPQDDSPGESGLARLQDAIASEGKAQQESGAAGDNVISFSAFARRPQPVTGWWRVAAIAACLLLIVQGALTLSMPGDDGLRFASGTYGYEGPVVQVIFVPQSSEEDIRTLLREVDAVIVDGPSALGIYRVAIKGEGDDAERLARALEALQNRKDIVEDAREE